MWYLYIIRCCDKTLYTGITTDISRRLREHDTGKGCNYTRLRTPVSLVYQEIHPDRPTALKREAQIKRWPRKRKIGLINCDSS